MKMEPIESSMFTHIGYDHERLVLLVRFHPSKKQAAAGEAGDLWEYSPVVPEKWAEMQAAESVGKWFLANVKGKYVANKVVADEAAAVPDDDLFGGEHASS